MIVVGVTGSLCSGKSEAAKIFKKMGAVIFDADQAARDSVKKGKPAYQAIRKLFGALFFKKDGNLDRAKLAAHVFKYPDDLRKLNVLIHPGVILSCFQVIQKQWSKKGMLVLDVPLLFESRMSRLADYTVVVGAGLGVTLSRAKKRGMAPSLSKKILSTQWSFRKKASKADFVIVNNGSLKELERKVRDVAEKIKKKESEENSR